MTSLTTYIKDNGISLTKGAFEKLIAASTIPVRTGIKQVSLEYEEFDLNRLMLSNNMYCENKLPVSLKTNISVKPPKDPSVYVYLLILSLKGSKIGFKVGIAEDIDKRVDELNSTYNEYDMLFTSTKQFIYCQSRSKALSIEKSIHTLLRLKGKSLSTFINNTYGSLDGYTELFTTKNSDDGTLDFLKYIFKTS